MSGVSPAPNTPTLQDAVSAAQGSANIALAAQKSATASSNASAVSAVNAANKADAATDTQTAILAVAATVKSQAALVAADLETSNNVQALLEASLPVIENLNLAAVAAVVASGPVLSINGETGIVTISFVSANSPALTGTPTAPTAPNGTNTTQIATCAYVLGSFLNAALTGIPTAPTPSNFTATGQIATTQFVINQLSATLTGTFAPLASPAFTGVPTAPTPALNTNTTQLATTAFTLGQAATATPLVDTTGGAVGTATTFARADHQHPPAQIPWTPIASTTVSGTPTTIPFTSIPQGYGDLLIVIAGIEGSASTSNVFIDVSNNNGSTWSASNGEVAVLSGASTAFSGSIQFSGYSLSIGYMIPIGYAQVVLTTNPSAVQLSTSGLSNLFTIHTGGCNGIRLRISTGTFLAAGTVTLYGK